jgi:hypothetical protein
LAIVAPLVSVAVTVKLFAPGERVSRARPERSVARHATIRSLTAPGRQR